LAAGLFHCVVAASWLPGWKVGNSDLMPPGETGMCSSTSITQLFLGRRSSESGQPGVYVATARSSSSVELKLPVCKSEI
jgi:hypothetical protein